MDYDSKFGVFRNRHLTQNEKSYFYINTFIFIANIILSIYFKNTLIAVCATVALLFSIYVYNADYHKNTIWILDQITILAILMPGLIRWLGNEMYEFPIAGLFFMSAFLIYIYSLFTKEFVHSESGETRIQWHVYLHIMVTIGHFMLNSEKKILAKLMLFI